MDVQLREFLCETSESLDAVEAELIALGTADPSAQILDGIFRLAHSIKGAASFLNLPQIETAAHQFETRLQSLRAGENSKTLLQAFDALRLAIVKLETRYGLEDPAYRAQQVSAADMRHFSMLVSELGLTRDALLALLQQKGGNHVFKEPLYRLSSIADELQKSFRRMQRRTLGDALRALPRLVHDLSQELGKNIELDIHGDDIMLDAVIIDGLKDPLIHAVRNAASHGIEMPEQRQAAGKTAFGKIVVSASWHEDRLMIVVSDDGAGFDHAAIRQAAVRERLVTAAEFDALSESEIARIILTPGFTSVPEATKLSGRGFGLDIMRSHVAALSGRISIRSAAGKGTVFMMTIPIEKQVDVSSPSLPDVAAYRDKIGDSHVPFLVFRAGNGRQKAVPVQLITRIEQIDLRQIRHAGGNKWARSGGDVLPLVYVNASLSQREAGLKPLLVFTDHTRAMGLVVDEIIGVVSAPLNIEFQDGDDDAIGTMMLNGAPTDIIDIGHYLPLAFGAEVQAGAPAAVKTETRKLIFVEDNAFFRDMLVPVLKDGGFDVEVFSSADAALEAMKTKALPEAIISDIDMPGMNGFEFAKTVKADARLSDVPLIALSSFLSRSAAERGRDAGFKTYIAKFDRQGLLKALKKGMTL